MGSVKLSDISVTPLKRIETQGGDVLHAMKNSEPSFCGFGEAYFSWISEGAVKAWKRHLKMTLNLVVPVGQVRFVFRTVSSNGVDEFRFEEIGIERYCRVTVPPGIWFGFQGIASPQSLLLNIASVSHDPLEVERLTQSDINFSWR